MLLGAALLLLVAATPEVCAEQGAECRDASCAGGAGQGIANGSAPRPDSPFPGSSSGPDATSAPQRDETAAAMPQVWQAASGLFELKLAFVTGIQRFTRAQTGTFGDEGGELQSALRAMRTALTQWDAAAKQFDESTARLRPSADLHVARASVFLLRHRPEDAVRELSKAARLGGDRPDIPALMSLAQAAAGRPAEAARAAKQALSREATNPVLTYVLAQRAAEAGQADEALRARAKVAQLLASVSIGAGSPVAGGAAPAGAAAADRAPFERYGLLRQAGGVAPIFPLAIYADGYALLTAGDFAGGLASLEKAMASDPLVHSTSASPAPSSDAVLRAAVFLRSGQTSAARDALSAAYAASSQRLLALADWADDAFDAAIDHARNAVTLDPSNERARLLLADVLHAAERVDDERQTLDDTVHVLPRAGAAHFRLGQLHEAQGRVDEARAAYLAAVKNAPVVGQDHLFFTLGNLAVKQADFGAAVDAYTQRVAVNPNSAEAHRQLGEVYFLQGRDDDALAEHSIAAYLSPRDGRAHAARGQALARLKQYDVAATAFARAVELGDGSVETRYGLGMALLRAGKADEGLAHIDASNRLRTEGAERGQRDFQVAALRRAARQAAQDGQHSEAAARLEEAAAQSPDDLDLRRDLGIALLAAGRVPDALARLALTQRDKPTAAGAEALARAYDAVGQTAGRDAARAQHARLLEQARRAKLTALAGGLAAPEN
jgi:tetratricopeptide (TPR) repeat protein